MVDDTGHAPVGRAPGGRRPRVLLVITRGERGGAQIHVHDLVIGLDESIDYHVIVGEPGYLAPALRAAGIAVEVMPSLQRAIAPAPDLATVRALRRRIRALQPALVHTHSTKAGLLGRLAAWSCGVPVIHTAHAWSFSDGLSWARKSWAIPVEAAAGRLTDRFITVSEADREVGTRWHVARDAQVRVIHNGVPDVADRAQPGAAVERPVIAMVARMAPPKDHALMLTALARVSAPCALWFIGDGPDRPRLEAQAAALGLGDRVRWLGVRADVPALLAQAHVFALVSRQEGFPLSILEGMRAGLPVVASEVGGVAEAVRDGDNGALVPRGDAAALARALDRLVADPGLRARQGAAARADFVRRFSLSQMLVSTRQVYGELAAPLGPAAVRATPGNPRDGVQR